MYEPGLLRVTVSASGRLKEPYWGAACAEYEKRLGAYCKLNVLEVSDGVPPECPAGAFLVALCVEGETPDSESFARLLQTWQNRGVSHIGFLIGGSEGLPAKVKSQADYRLSLSRLTWPHHMARAMLEEQLYRALNWLAGGKYHK